MPDTEIKWGDSKVDNMVSISKARLDELEEKEDWLNSLEAAGVDNWDGYDYAREIHNNDES